MEHMGKLRVLDKFLGPELLQLQRECIMNPSRGLWNIPGISFETELAWST